MAAAHYTGTLSAYTSNPLQGGIPLSYGDADVTFQSDVGTLALPYNVSVNPALQTLRIDQTIQQSITTYVGAALTLDAQINISASGQGQGNFKASGGGSGSVNSVFDIQAQTAGVILTRGSTAVPEPSAFVTVLLGAGMLGMAARRRRN